MHLGRGVHERRHPCVRECVGRARGEATPRPCKSPEHDIPTYRAHPWAVILTPAWTSPRFASPRPSPRAPPLGPRAQPARADSVVASAHALEPPTPARSLHSKSGLGGRLVMGLSEAGALLIQLLAFQILTYQPPTHQTLYITEQAAHQPESRCKPHSGSPTRESRHPTPDAPVAVMSAECVSKSRATIVDTVLTGTLLSA